MYPRLGISCSKDGRDMMWKTYYWGGVGVFKVGNTRYTILKTPRIKKKTKKKKLIRFFVLAPVDQREENAVSIG